LSKFILSTFHFFKMANVKLAIIAFFLCSTSVIYGQLGFCGGSTGDAIFTESFGNGTNYGPPLAPGITTYNYVAGPPQDSFYTLFYRTNLLGSWHNSLDRTPDNTDGINGKCLVVNANNNVSGAFYKRTVTGLCVNTTFEFSAWVLNVYNLSSNICTNNEIPVNVRFEIWNETETALLGSGDTGNIFSTSSPLWQQYALVFTTTNQTSVVLIMKNNGVGGCGNDLAIDDIAFKSCGDLTTISNVGFPTNNFATCDTTATVSLGATTNGTSTYFYQWQSSTDNENWIDSAGQNNASFTTPGVSVTTYFRTKIAQDIANINSPFCSTVSNIFTVTILPDLAPAISNGNVVSCSNQAIPELAVTTSADHVVSWYNQPVGGTLLLSGSATFTPSGAGTYYAEVVNPTTSCSGSSRTAVTLTITQEPVASFTGILNYCSGQMTSINLQSDVTTTTFSWTAASTDVVGAADGSGAIINQTLTASAVTGSVTYVVTPVNNGCTGTPFTIVATVYQLPTADFQSSSAAVCSNDTANLLFTGTPGALVNFTDGTTTYTITLDGMGAGGFITNPLVADTTFSLLSAEVNASGLCLQNITGTVTITVESSPLITVQPIDETVCGNGGVTFTVVATGSNLNYQWFFNGTPITGATNTSYTIGSVVASDAGDYTVEVAGICGTSETSETSDSVTLNLVQQTIITAQPQALTTVCSGEAVNLVLSAPGTDFTYQWYIGTTPITGATAQTYSIAASTIADSGNYTCLVTTPTCGTVISDVAVVVVNQGPVLTSQPQNNEICVGQTVTFATVATGTNLTYQWFKGTTAISGATSNVYSISNAAQSATGDYYCEISSVSCLSVTTNTVSLLVKPLPFATISQVIPSFICEGESVQIIFNGSANAIVTYTVNGGTAENITLLAGVPTILATGILNETTVYELVSVAFNEANACSQDLTGSFTITVNPLPSVTLEDGILCVDPITLATTRTYLLNTGLNEAEFTFEWFDTNGVIPLAANSFYEASTIGQYGVTISNIVTGCEASAFANVTQSAPPTDFAYTVSGFFANNPTIVITATPPAAYEYQLDFGPFQDSNIFDNIATGPHMITVRDREACDVLSKELLIIDYPRFFTPNGDGINDVWNIPTISTISVSRIYIFDQFGKLIKEMSATGSGWDGTYNGQTLPATDYWFTINYQEEGITKEFRSHFSLKR
jgi:gliding motility-associated-like protein